MRQAGDSKSNFSGTWQSPKLVPTSSQQKQSLEQCLHFPQVCGRRCGEQQALGAVNATQTLRCKMCCAYAILQPRTQPTGDTKSPEKAPLSAHQD